MNRQVLRICRYQALKSRRRLCLQVRSSIKAKEESEAPVISGENSSTENSQLERKSKRRQFNSIAEYDNFVREALVVLNEEKIERKKSVNKINLIVLGTCTFALIMYFLSGLIQIQDTMRFRDAHVRKLKEQIKAERAKLR